MTAPPASHPVPLAPEILAEVARVRASGVLAAGGRLSELFEFLVARSADETPPKEAEIAISVFGKRDPGASHDDPVARVYIHRLRKRLDDFYQRNGVTGSVRLQIPRGEYRIAGAPPEEPPAAAATDEPVTPAVKTARLRKAAALLRQRWPVAAAALACLLLLGNIAAWVAVSGQRGDAAPAAASSPLWKTVSTSERPLLMVVGDYYMFGEYEDRLFLKRLIRDFSINSKDDLVERHLTDPKGFDRYGDVALQYLPTSTAFALADIMPLVGGQRQVQVMMASELTPDRLKANDIIFVGLFSGLGKLREPVFGRSRFGFGESYDQLIDRQSGRTYTSEAFLAAPSDTMYRDYGFFATFAGPSGNRIMVLSGSRDTALTGVAETLTQPGKLEALRAETGGLADMEVLFEVKGQKHVNLETDVLAFAAIDSRAVWSGAPAAPPEFPLE